MKSLSLAEAKATLSERIREVEDGDPIIITRHGRAVAALVRPEDLEHLMRLRAAGPSAGLISVVGGWEGSDELVREIEATGRGAGRDVPDLD